MQSSSYLTLLSLYFRHDAANSKFGKMWLLCSCWRNSYFNSMWRYCRYTSAQTPANGKLGLLCSCWRNSRLNCYVTVLLSLYFRYKTPANGKYSLLSSWWGISSFNSMWRYRCYSSARTPANGKYSLLSSWWSNSYLNSYVTLLSLYFRYDACKWQIVAALFLLKQCIFELCICSMKHKSVFSNPLLTCKCRASRIWCAETFASSSQLLAEKLLCKSFLISRFSSPNKC
jgi:hypothetical protein